jgi:hypothetical protein
MLLKHPDIAETRENICVTEIFPLFRCALTGGPLNGVPPCW